MHLQQTKVERTGGPQYYFHDVPAAIKNFLRGNGACPVILETPYGITTSPFMAVGTNHKLVDGKPVPGKVGHDRAGHVEATEPISEEPHGVLERITDAAVRLSDGSVYAGLFHGDALEKANAVHGDKPERHYRKLFVNLEDGFMTDKQRFVSREQAYEIAIKGRQITRKSYADAVEDLWGARPKMINELGALAFNNARSANNKVKTK